MVFLRVFRGSNPFGCGFAVLRFGVFMFEFSPCFAAAMEGECY
jgi:hypothetical protein